MKKLDNGKWLVVGRDNKPDGKCMVYYCDSPADMERKSTELQSMGLQVRSGTVRSLLGA